LDKTEVEKMAKEAETHADEDKAKKELVEARNLLDSAVYQAEKLQKDNGEKISDDDKKVLEEAIEAAKKVIGDDKADKEALENASKELNDKLMPIGAKMYEQAEAADKSEDAAADADASDEKTDAIEGEVVDDKDKSKKD
jgi:molecular chaperone DnaK